VNTAVQGSCKWCVHDPCTRPYHGPSVHGGHVHGRVYHPATRPLPAHTAVYSRVRTVYTAVHGPCTRAVNTTGYRVHDRVGEPCTRPWTHHVHGPYTVRTPRERPCTRYVQCRAHQTAVFTVHSRVRAAYTAVIGSRTDHVRGRCTAVYTVCSRPWAAVYTGRKHGRVQGTRPCRCTLYTAVDAPCTRPLHAGVHGPYTS